jgi:phosphoglycolate phosphatase (TIGR01487 family)
VTDIDGTLTDGTQKISNSALKAVKYIEKKRVPVLLASGKALPIVKTLKLYLGCSGAIICENGSVIEYLDKMKVIGNRDVVRSVLKQLKEEFEERIVEAWSNPYRYVDVAFESTLERSLIENVVSKNVGVKLVDSGFAYHLMSEGVNKAEGLKIACDLMGIKLHETVAIGDSETDIDLLQVAGFKIALANAPQSLRIVSDYVTQKPYGEGVLEAAKMTL